MISRLLVSTLSLIIATIFIAAGNNALPRQGESALLQRVAPAPITDGARVWDFSEIDMNGSPIEVRFDWANDSCLSASLPGIRYDFEISGDTIFRTAVETRFILLSDTIPMPYALSSQEGSIVSLFASRGVAYHSEYINSFGGISLSPVVKGTLILPPGDTIADVTLTRHYSSIFMAADFNSLPEISPDSLISVLHRTTVTNTWISPQYPVPLAQVTEVIDSIGNTLRGYPVTTAWICTPENQPSRAAATRFNTNKNFPSPSPVNNDDLISGLSVSVSENTVSISGSATAEGPVEIMLTDIVGRVFASASKNCHPGGDIEWSCDNIPSGQYLLHINAGDGLSITEKIIIK